jgi:hypothetical protein
MVQLPEGCRSLGQGCLLGGQRCLVDGEHVLGPMRGMRPGQSQEDPFQHTDGGMSLFHDADIVLGGRRCRRRTWRTTGLFRSQVIPLYLPEIAVVGSRRA